jgi:hypothetical protein
MKFNWNGKKWVRGEKPKNDITTFYKKHYIIVVLSLVVLCIWWWLVGSEMIIVKWVNRWFPL